MLSKLKCVTSSKEMFCSASCEKVKTFQFAVFRRSLKELQNYLTNDPSLLVRENVRGIIKENVKAYRDDCLQGV